LGSRALAGNKYIRPVMPRWPTKVPRLGASRLPKLEQKVFPPARQAAEPSLHSKACVKRAWTPAQHLRPMHVDSANGPAFQQRRQVTDQHFDFR
jgi:hypothetical protein